MELAGKTALVTGATDGIGACLIRQLRERGTTVIATGRDAGRVAATRGHGFETIQADLATPAGVAQVLDAVKGRVIDILINNAGAGVTHDYRQGIPDLDESDQIVFLNLQAPIHLIAALMPMLRERPEAAILNVTSGLAIAPNTASAIYCATKAALRSYTMSLREQLKGTAIKVIEGLPPLVDTKMTAGRGSNKMAPEECARQFVVALEGGANEANVGMVKVLKLVHSISPALARRIMLNF